jgi:lysozyme family protein
VNSGPAQAIKSVQRVVGTNRDGSMGPKTLAAINAMSRPVLIRELCDRPPGLHAGSETWATFGKGWTKRVNKVREAALDMTIDRARDGRGLHGTGLRFSSEASAPAKPTDTFRSSTKQGKARSPPWSGAMVSLGAPRSS